MTGTGVKRKNSDWVYLMERGNSGRVIVVREVKSTVCILPGKNL